MAKRKVSEEHYERLFGENRGFDLDTVSTSRAECIFWFQDTAKGRGEQSYYRQHVQPRAASDALVLQDPTRQKAFQKAMEEFTVQSKAMETVLLGALSVELRDH